MYAVQKEGGGGEQTNSLAEFEPKISIRVCRVYSDLLIYFYSIFSGRILKLYSQGTLNTTTLKEII